MVYLRMIQDRCIAPECLARATVELVEASTVLANGAILGRYCTRHGNTALRARDSIDKAAWASTRAKATA